MLQWCVAADDRAAAAEGRGGGDARPVPTVPTDPAPTPDLAAAGRRVLDDLPGRATRFHLATSEAQLPKHCTPVLRVLAGGTIQIRVAPPLASRPGAVTWPDVGVLLPRVRVCDLSASERSSLLAIWSRLAGPGRLTVDRVRTAGCRFQEGELQLLLGWLR